MRSAARGECIKLHSACTPFALVAQLSSLDVIGLRSRIESWSGELAGVRPVRETRATRPSPVAPLPRSPRRFPARCPPAPPPPAPPPPRASAPRSALPRRPAAHRTSQHV
ncbi:uncharacterized protein LOC143909295 [Arctopsyche grandis]|uniref:uncharacterized protein LOC143909295 n=1 Tax=Arctopsyche grandis TaxID=121162 RepID=UPI00406D7913